MPRVNTATRQRVVIKRPMVCVYCHEPIEVGQTYYHWKKRVGGIQYKHYGCGTPKQSELSNRKTAVLYDAVDDADDQITSWQPDIEEPDVSELESFLGDVAQVAREIGEEYEASADNMPEGLQSGAQAEAMREVASELEDWASNAEDLSLDEPEYDDREEGQSVEAYEQYRQETFDAWVEQAREEARDLIQAEIPEYQG